MSGWQVIDWQLITIQLRRHYKPLAAVAKEIGCDEQHLTRLMRGEVDQPRYNTGVKLLALHERTINLSVIVQKHLKRLREQK